jgi:hypothetical protein
VSHAILVVHQDQNKQPAVKDKTAASVKLVVAEDQAKAPAAKNTASRSSSKTVVEQPKPRLVVADKHKSLNTTSTVKSPLATPKAKSPTQVVQSVVEPKKPAPTITPNVLFPSQAKATPKPRELEIGARVQKPSELVLAPKTETKPVVVAGQDAYVTTGIIVFENVDPVPQPKTPPVVAVKKPAAKPAITAQAPTAAPKANPKIEAKKPETTEQLQKSVASACHKKPSDVNVEKNGLKLTIQIKASRLSEGDDLKDTVFRLPELAPYQVDLDILIGR